VVVTGGAIIVTRDALAGVDTVTGCIIRDVVTGSDVFVNGFGTSGGSKEGGNSGDIASASRGSASGTTDLFCSSPNAFFFLAFGLLLFIQARPEATQMSIMQQSIATMKTTRPRVPREPLEGELFAREMLELDVAFVISGVVDVVVLIAALNLGALIFALSLGTGIPVVVCGFCCVAAAILASFLLSHFHQSSPSLSWAWFAKAVTPPPIIPPATADAKPMPTAGPTGIGVAFGV